MEVPRHWRLKKQRYSLIGETCPNCEKPLFPPQPVCPKCGTITHESKFNPPLYDSNKKISQEGINVSGENVFAVSFINS